MGKVDWLKAGSLVILNDDSGIAAELKKQLGKIGVETSIVEKIPADAKNVIWLSGFKQKSGNNIQTYQNLNKEVFKIGRHLAANFHVKDGVFILAYDNGLAHPENFKRSWSGGLSAFAKTAQLEWENVNVQSVNIDSYKKKPEEIASLIFKAITTGGDQTEINVDKNGNISGFINKPAIFKNKSRPLKENSVFIVSGGAKGVTAECLIALSRQAPLKIGIFGRTTLAEEPEYLANLTTEAEIKKALFDKTRQDKRSFTPVEISRKVKDLLGQREAKHTIKRLEDLGSEVTYLPVDISSKKDVIQAVDSIRDHYGPINGIIHGAGVLADKYIHEKTDAQFDLVFNTKVKGFENLLEATKSDPLSHICCFSSIAARMGNIGQVDYAMANEVLNKVCQAEQVKRDTKCLVKSINWGPWDGGMVSPQLKKHFSSLGVGLIPVEIGATSFCDEISDASTEQVEVVMMGTIN